MPWNKDFHGKYYKYFCTISFFYSYTTNVKDFKNRISEVLILWNFQPLAFGLFLVGHSKLTKMVDVWLMSRRKLTSELLIWNSSVRKKRPSWPPGETESLPHENWAAWMIIFYIFYSMTATLKHQLWWEQLHAEIQATHSSEEETQTDCFLLNICTG